MCRSRVLTFAATLGAGALLAGGCGSATKTVSVSATPTTPATSTSRAHTSTATTGSATTATGTSATATRTSPEPAFTHGGASASGEARAAAAAVRAHGYTPNDASEYHAGQTLRVLVGTRTGSGDGYDQQAFFFLGARYIGTDTSRPSAGIRIVGQADTEVTLSYPLYAPHDALCCPSGGHADVRFQLNDGKLTPLGSIPPASSSTGLSRQ